MLDSVTRFLIWIDTFESNCPLSDGLADLMRTALESFVNVNVLGIWLEYSTKIDILQIYLAIISWQKERCTRHFWKNQSAALACFVSGYKHKFTYIMRTIPSIRKTMKKIEDPIINQFQPAITGEIKWSFKERSLMYLPEKLDAWNFNIHWSFRFWTWCNSKLSNEILCNKIIERDISYDPDIEKKEINNNISAGKLIKNSNIPQKLRWM